MLWNCFACRPVVFPAIADVNERNSEAPNPLRFIPPMKISYQPGSCKIKSNSSYWGNFPPVVKHILEYQYLMNLLASGSWCNFSFSLTKEEFFCTDSNLRRRGSFSFPLSKVVVVVCNMTSWMQNNVSGHWFVYWKETKCLKSPKARKNDKGSVPFGSI